jgi:O-antigen/teichoic acid export membrane protein
MSVARNTLLNLGGAVLPMLVALATVPIYLGYVGAERYGVLAVIWALLGYFGFFDLGFGRAVTQRMACLTDATASDRSALLWTALLTTLALGIVAGVLLWMFADYIVLNLIGMSATSRLEAAGAIAWLLGALPILLPMSVLMGALQARLRFAELNAIQLFGNLVSQVLPLYVAHSGHVGLSALVPAVLASRVLMMALLLQQGHRHVPLRGMPTFDRSHFNAMIAYGSWVSVMTILGPLLVTLDRLIIGAISGAKAVTAYTVPYDLVSRTRVLSGSLATALFPRLASSSVAEGQTIASRATQALLAVMTPVTIIGLFIAQPFLNVWIGPARASLSGGVSELILLGVWCNALAIPHHARLLAAGNPKVVVLIYVIQIPAYLLLLWFGLRYWGVVGAAGAWTLRVAIDTSMLLAASSVLRVTLWRSALSLTLVGTAAAIVLAAHLPPTPHWGIGAVLLGWSLVKDRALLLHLFRSLAPTRRAAA